MNPSYRVEFTEPAIKDLKDVFRWVGANDSIGKATQLLQKLQATCNSLSTLPARGHVLPELEAVGHQGHLEIHEGPYRILYQIQAKTVYIVAVLDGRRNMEELLGKRLLG
ncbi:MAG: type II toxin-antitoxin system RelE/ParE family toxin [bacterium]|nr:type II toxin-antitoxin system RelE/ParE family toxin [bacterium]